MKEERGREGGEARRFRKREKGGLNRAESSKEET